jgi:hypothetical protein
MPVVPAAAERQLPRGPMRNIAKNAAVTARTREEKFRAAIRPLNYPRRNKGFNITSNGEFRGSVERSNNGQEFRYNSQGSLVKGNEWLGSASRDPNRNMPWQGTYGNNGEYLREGTKGGKYRTRRNKKTRSNKSRRNRH